MLPFPLAALPDLFELRTKDKGVFPFYMNTEKNRGLILSQLPDKKYFNYEYMSIEKRGKLDEWYEVEKNKTWNLDKTLEEYCVLDTTILTEACLCFRQEMMNLVGYDPFRVATTLSSLSLFLIRTEFVDCSLLPHLPEAGYGSTRQSELAMKYIRWEEEKRGYKLQHKWSPRGEKVVSIYGRKYHIDAFDEELKEVIEVNGCWIHGCSLCFSRDVKIREETAGSLYDRTVQRAKHLASYFKVTTVWEHEIREQLIANTEMSDFFDNCEVITRLRPREALQGGR